jgi:transcriptional regulator with XRE-family HTH domain
MSIRLDIDKIEESRKERGWRKQDLAKRAGITPMRLSQIFAEARRGIFPFPARVREIVEVLGLSMDDVVIKTDEGIPPNQDQPAA